MNRYMTPGYEFSITGKHGKYTIIKQMGKGNSCMVYLAEFMDEKGNYTEHILKEYNPVHLQVMRNEQGSIFVDRQEQQEFTAGLNRFAEGYKRQQQIRKMVGLKNVTTNIQDIFEAQGTRYIDMTFFEGTVYHGIQEKNLYSLLQRAKALTSILGNYHNAGYLHLDVKPDNIFTIPETCEFVMLYDFDSVVEKEQVCMVDHLSCTKEWAAPELLNPDAHHLVCEATDLFAVGEIVFYQMMGHHSEPEERRSFSKYEYDVKSPLFKNVNSKVFQKLTEFFHGTIRSSVKQRYQSAEEVIEKLDELLLLANPKESYLAGSLVAVGEFFVGREKELESIYERLRENHVLFLSGIGGIGKSALAKQYANRYKESYDTIVFLTYSGSFLTLINDDKNLFIVNFEKQQEETPEEYCARKLAKLKEVCDERTLFIVDNLNQNEFNEKETLLWQELLQLRCKILFTTRLNEWDYPKMEIQELDTLETQGILFQHYCEVEDVEQRAAAEEIIHYVEAHTLLMELIAKQIKATFSTPVDMLSLLKEDGIGAQTLFGHIRQLFNIAELSEEEIYVLSNMALFPVNGVSAKNFLAWCELPDFDNVNRLLEKGWIKREAGKLKMHPVISAVALEVLMEKEENCETLLLNIICVDLSVLELEERLSYIEILEHIILCLIKNNMEMTYVMFLCDVLAGELSQFARAEEASYYMKMASDIRDQIFENEKTDELLLMLDIDGGNMYVQQGAYDKAEKEFRKVLKICEATGQKETTALAYNNMGFYYIQQGKYEKAEKSLLQGLKVLGEEKHQDSRSCLYLYRTLGFLYSQSGKYHKAQKYLGKALEVCKKLYGDKHLETIATYQWFGMMFYNKQQMERAESYLGKALEICEEIGEHNYKAGILINLAQTVYEEGRLEEAEQKCREGIMLLKSLGGVETDTLALAYETLGYIYEDAEKSDKAEKYFKKALKIYKYIGN